MHPHLTSFPGNLQLVLKRSNRYNQLSHYQLTQQALTLQCWLIFQLAASRRDNNDNNEYQLLLIFGSKSFPFSEAVVNIDRISLLPCCLQIHFSHANLRWIFTCVAIRSNKALIITYSNKRHTNIYSNVSRKMKVYLKPWNKIQQVPNASSF